MQMQNGIIGAEESFPAEEIRHRKIFRQEKFAFPRKE